MEVVAGHCRYIEFHYIVQFKMVKTANFMFCVFYHYKQLRYSGWWNWTVLCETQESGPLMCSRGWVADT